jgi:hypothetical protein
MKKWIYRHYKWKNYEVLWTALHSETLEKLVIYKALYNSKEFWNESIWIRPFNMFNEEIEFEWKIVERFRHIENLL